MDAYTAVVSKRDRRTFRAEPVPREALSRILNAGRMAGSAKNRQPCRFVVVDDQAMKAKLAGYGDFSRWIADAAVNVVIVVPQDARDLDAGRAAQNMMIVANAAGLASCPVTLQRGDEAMALLGIPAGNRIAITVALGFPAAEGSAVAKEVADIQAMVAGPRIPLDGYVHRGGWQAGTQDR